MKKNWSKIIVPIIALGAAMPLSGCSSSAPVGKINIDFGTYRSKDISDFLEIKESSYDNIYAKAIKKESFVLAIYSGSVSGMNQCGCWGKFKEVLKDYVNETHINVDYINTAQFEDHSDKLGLFLEPSVVPSLAIFKRGKLVIQTVYGRDDKKVFEHYDIFREFVDKYVELPKMYYISKNDLDSFILEDKNFNLYFAQTRCPDCQRVTQNVLYNWSDSVTSVSSPLYIFDVQTYRDTDEEYYKTVICAEYGLNETANPTLGWKTGFVPTFQARKGSTILDMIVVNNDKYDTNTKTVESYFTNERLEYMTFLKESDKITNKVLNGMTIETYDRDVYESTYVDPITKLFLDTYVK